MDLQTNLNGRLKNTQLPYHAGLLPVCEALINSIHATEEAALPLGEAKIQVEILRTKQQSLDFSKGKKVGTDQSREIQGFRITDNGIGFTDDNMNSFLTLDSEYKAHRGGRGVGRLLWLKAFERVYVRSVYLSENGHPNLRTFTFTSRDGVGDVESVELPLTSQRTTSVELNDFASRYREGSRKTSSAIATALFEHCLWYFVRKGGAPKIIVIDGPENIDLDSVYERYMFSSADVELVNIKNNEFELNHIKLRTTSSNAHGIAYCADNRLVKQETISGRVPGLYGRLKDEAGDFIYTCYVTSPFLDERVRSERTDFNISPDTDALFAETDLAMDEIRNEILKSAARHLASYLEANKVRAKERIDEFVSRKAPRYRPILSHIPEEKLLIDPGISDRDLDITLHRHLADIEENLLRAGHDVMQRIDEADFPDYQSLLQEYLQTAEDIKKSDLANYVAHRRTILALLEKAIRRKEDGSYVCEDLIHQLIMPMGVTSNEIRFDNCNLWIIDERMAFHNYLASDKQLRAMPITDCSEGKEPDICALNVFDNPILASEGSSLPLASIIVVEIKRPMRDDARGGESKDPIEQALGYLKRIRDGNVKTASGRQIPRAEHIPGFCYVICDITQSVRQRCEMHDAILTSDGLGYFFYHKRFQAYVEVLSFDRLLNGAKERNRAFFDRLGLPV